MPEYLLPDVGEGLTEAEIVTWKVKVGDVVAINDVVVEIETAKSLVELPSPFAGEVTALLVPEGQTVAVGTPIIAIGEPAEMSIDLSNPAASGGGEGESLVGRTKADRAATRRPRRRPVTEAAAQRHALAGVHDTYNQNATHQAEQVERLTEAVTTAAAEQARAAGAPEETPATPETPATEAASPGGPVVSSATSQEVRALAKPPVRKLARDLGVDLAALAGSGPSGSVTRDDVQAAAGAAAAHPAGPAPATLAATGEREVREPVKGVRKMMAGAMVASAFSAPHVTEWVTVDVSATTELVERLRARREFRGLKVGPLLVLARAVLLAIRRTPVINSWFDDEAQEVVLKSYVNLGIAAATPRGLVVPNVKDAQDLSLVELAQALADLTATAREGRTQPAEMAGGTFTITNVGVFGVDAGTPIINPGESAILCFGAVRRQPWVVVRDGVEQIVPRDITTLALSFDHRHIDGEAGSRFLADVAGLLEDPGTALLF